MAKGLFFSIPAYGHTNPTLPVVKELVSLGEEIIYYSSPEFCEQVQATGAIFRDYHTQQTGEYIQQTSKDIAMLYYFMVKSTRDVLDYLMDDVKQMNADYIIHDAICPWGRHIASICNLPAVTSVPTFVFDPRGISLQKSVDFFRHSPIRSIRYIGAARRLQAEMKQKYGIQPGGLVETLMNKEDLNIVYTSSEFQPNSERLDPSQYKFVGPSISARMNDQDTSDYSQLKHPLIYLSMGTVWKDSFSMDELIEDLQIYGGSIVVSGTDTTGKYNLDKNIIIKEHTNQLEVLKYCDVFISHGGMNSVNEALYWGVPLCLHPFQVEQEMVADRVVALKCGLRIRSFAREEIQDAVQKLMEIPEYRENCRRIGRSFMEAGGYRQAAQYILAYTQK